MASIGGECDCLSGMVWDDKELECFGPSFWLSVGGFMLILTGSCAILVSVFLICCCLCGDDDDV